MVNAHDRTRFVLLCIERGKLCYRIEKLSDWRLNSEEA
jgi:hypothetical protein